MFPRPDASPVNRFLFSDLTVDLGAIATITSVDLEWKAAYGEAYDVEVASTSPDEPGSWETVFTTVDGDGDDDTIALDGVDGRYASSRCPARSISTVPGTTASSSGRATRTMCGG